MQIEIRIVAHDSSDYWKVVDLRRRVLRTPLGLDFSAERLSGEASEIHLSAWEGDIVVGAVVLRPPGEDGCAHLGQMAVAPEMQGKGIGAQLVRQLERIAADNGWNQIAMEARQSAFPFYEKLGYKGEGEPYIHAIGIPTIIMRKHLLL